MKKVLLSLFVLLACALSVRATDTTISIADVKWTSANDATYGQGFSGTQGTFSLGVYKAKSTTAIVSPTDLVKVYKDGAFRIKTLDGSHITSVVMTCSALRYCADATINQVVTKADTAKLTITWSGKSDTVTCMASTAQLRISQLVIATDAVASVANPTFSINGGIFDAAQTVSLACATTGASIYYTTDGSDPTSASTLYNGAITVSKSTELKAIAIKGSDKSQVVSQTYYISAAVSDVASFMALMDNTPVTFKNSVTAIYQNHSNLFAKDATGYFIVYGSTGQTYINGDVIPAGISGVKITYNGGPELKTPAGFAKGTAGTAVEPVAVTVDAVKAADAYKYVVLNNVTVDISAKTLTSGANSIAYYSNIGATLPAANGIYNVKGFVSVHNDVIQILPVSFDVPTGINEVVAAQSTNAETFDLVGRQVSAPVKGQLYIKAHKKFIAK